MSPERFSVVSVRMYINKLKKKNLLVGLNKILVIHRNHKLNK